MTIAEQIAGAVERLPACCRRCRSARLTTLVHAGVLTVPQALQLALDHESSTGDDSRGRREGEIHRELRRGR